MFAFRDSTSTLWEAWDVQLCLVYWDILGLMSGSHDGFMHSRSSFLGIPRIIVLVAVTVFQVSFLCMPI